jgi:hypothetical protein
MVIYKNIEIEKKASGEEMDMGGGAQTGFFWLWFGQGGGGGVGVVMTQPCGFLSAPQETKSRENRERLSPTIDFLYTYICTYKLCRKTVEFS